MSSIKPKIAPCIDCIEQGDNTPKVLTAKRCQSHYWQHRNKINVVKAKSNPKPITASKAIQGANNTNLGKWFERQISICPSKCEECGTRISHYKYMDGHWATSLIAHILPKAKNKFPEVATHPNNRMFFCPQCHNKYDNNKDFRQSIKSLPILEERFKTFINELSDTQRFRALDYLGFDIEVKQEYDYE